MHWMRQWYTTMYVKEQICSFMFQNLFEFQLFYHCNGEVLTSVAGVYQTCSAAPTSLTNVSHVSTAATQELPFWGRNHRKKHMKVHF